MNRADRLINVKLDAGTDERIMLVSRDEQSVLVVSYKDVKACIASAFTYVCPQYSSISSLKKDCLWFLGNCRSRRDEECGSTSRQIYTVRGRITWRENR